MCGVCCVGGLELRAVRSFFVLRESADVLDLEEGGGVCGWAGGRLMGDSKTRDSRSASSILVDFDNFLDMFADKEANGNGELQGKTVRLEGLARQL